MSILDYLEPTRVVLPQPSTEHDFLAPAVIRPDVYSHAWVFCSTDEDEYVLEHLENLCARLERVFDEPFEINRMRPAPFAYAELFDVLPVVFRHKDSGDYDVKNRWILQFNLRRKLTPKSVFRIIVSMTYWICDINDKSTLASVIYESNGSVYGRLLDATEGFYSGCLRIKRGEGQVQPGKILIVEQLMTLTGRSDIFFRDDYDWFYKEYTAVYQHYKETRHGLSANSYIRVEEAIESMQKLSQAATALTVAVSKVGPKTIQILRNAIDFRHSYNK